jgi:hypothetical protein
MKNLRTVLLMSFIIITAAGAFFTAGLIVGGVGGYRFIEATSEPEDAEQIKAEYYRGVYDVCVQQTKKPEFCLSTVKKVTDSGWYEKPSTGWQWPLDESKSVAQGN